MKHLITATKESIVIVLYGDISDVPTEVLMVYLEGIGFGSAEYVEDSKVEDWEQGGMCTLLFEDKLNSRLYDTKREALMNINNK